MICVCVLRKTRAKNEWKIFSEKNEWEKMTRNLATPSERSELEIQIIFNNLI